MHYRRMILRNPPDLLTALDNVEILIDQEA